MHLSVDIVAGEGETISSPCNPAEAELGIAGKANPSCLTMRRPAIQSYSEG